MLYGKIILFQNLPKISYGVIEFPNAHSHTKINSDAQLEKLLIGCKAIIGSMFLHLSR